MQAPPPGKAHSHTQSGPAVFSFYLEMHTSKVLHGESLYSSLLEDKNRKKGRIPVVDPAISLEAFWLNPPPWRQKAL